MRPLFVTLRVTFRAKKKGSAAICALFIITQKPKVGLGFPSRPGVSNYSSSTFCSGDYVGGIICTILTFYEPIILTSTRVILTCLVREKSQW